ncbi:TPA: toll/interleukin-1 receptor domain-containing protein [Stenotrophomonas maltophilia]|uniref:toll/interleukin-1 receptor domain-containing protein n=1 Tax=Stenotrophomonas maltophilia TaxID=40324 RepID=UPI000DA8E6CF|nr:toll/interleukin-1 receptor domain-containing protein [Stenotrophomonas maltophilia]MCU1012456.1 toll/interleukin-1 receptor domain-containing protein [Stenotrophomonas maltophilia]PZS89328.1 TIR domain-containing protein [Stenotrophomonas maltophilia]
MTGDWTYELAVLGYPSAEQIEQLEACVSQTISAFGLQLGQDVSWSVHEYQFEPAQSRASAAIYFGKQNSARVAPSIPDAVPVVPVVDDLQQVSLQLPPALQTLNALAWSSTEVEGIAAALLECAGLLPRQRRVFLSYRRQDAKLAAVQLFDAFSARQFDVFLDTHGVPPASDFQAMLWHRLCDSDVLVMLDTPGYFESRWTSAEFGRALAKGIVVLRVQWPDTTPNRQTLTSSRAELVQEEIDASGRLADEAVERICLQLERARSESIAVRHVNLVSKIRADILKIGGQFLGAGRSNSLHLQLADGHPLVAYPSVGVPTSSTLHEASINCLGKSAAVVYDSIGLLPTWQTHLDWLGGYVRGVRWIKASEAAWQFAAWEEHA